MKNLHLGEMVVRVRVAIVRGLRAVYIPNLLCKVQITLFWAQILDGKGILQKVNSNEVYYTSSPLLPKVNVGSIFVLKRPTLDFCLGEQRSLRAKISWTAVEKQKKFHISSKEHALR